jgi:GR25 family glycosyltransferase involved in LPS biosynthesis
MEHIVYINLEHRKDRKKHMEAQFARMGLSGERIDATYHVHGYIGCTLSHIRCVELAMERQWPSVCIMEDDVLFTDPTLCLSLVDKFLRTHSKWDVLLLAGNAVPPYRKEDGCRKVFYARTTTAYVVRQEYYATLLDNFKEGLQLVERFHRNEYMIDMHWMRLQQKDSWYLLDPLTVVQLPSYSDIENKDVDYQRAMLSYKDS